MMRILKYSPFSDRLECENDEKKTFSTSTNYSFKQVVNKHKAIMVSCENFESNFEAWKKEILDTEVVAEMRRHASACDHCALFNHETAELRDALEKTNKYEPAVGFEFRLRKRITEAASGKSPLRKSSFNLSPRWAAMGAGLATGAIIGIALLLPSDQGVPGLDEMTAEATGPTFADGQQQLVADTTVSPLDTTKHERSNYNYDIMTQTVSSQPQEQ